jgi:hypothetical protein
MGVDFLKSKAKSFNKGWDLSRVELARKGLFTREPDCLATGVVAKMIGTPLRTGDSVLVRTDGDRLVVVDDLAVRAVFVKPPPDVFDKIRASGGYAKGEIALAMPSLQLVEVTIR